MLKKFCNLLARSDTNPAAYRLASVEILDREISDHTFKAANNKGTDKTVWICDKLKK